MKIYLVSRTDKVDYDEHAAFVVRAKSPKRAKEMCIGVGFYGTRLDNLKVKEVSNEDKEEIILEDFRAG